MKTLIPALALGLATLARVAPAQIPQQLPPAVITDTAVNSVTVQNNRKAPATVYMETGTFDRRLGIVPPYTVKTLPLPSWAVKGRTTVRLFAHPDDEAADLATESFTLTPPGRIGMVIPTREALHAVARTDTMMAVLPPEELANATLTVDNPREVPVTVFATQGRFDVRLGQVAPKSRVTLRFPKTVLSPFSSVEVFVHPQGDRDLGSSAFTVRPGEHLGLRVPPR